MNTLKSKSLAQIVSSNHQAAAILEKYHLDFCCKGKRSLQQACNEKQLSVNEVASELKELMNKNNLENFFDFDKISLNELIDYIVDTHHAFVKKELPLIFSYLEKVAVKHSDRHPEMIKVFQLFAAVKEELEGHMKKEELILFPRIKEIEKQLQAGSGNFGIKITYLQSPITIMEQEHDHAGSLLNEIRILADDYTPPEDACTTFRLSIAALQAFELDLHQHVHLENNILFPKSIFMFKNLQESVLN